MSTTAWLPAFSEALALVECYYGEGNAEMSSIEDFSLQ